MKWFRKLAGMSNGRKAIVVFLFGLLACYIFALPSKIFDKPYSTVLEASNGQLLSAGIASDGQWRFPQSDSIPERFKEALITFEDKRFYYHPGVDPLSMLRAAFQNLRERKIVSGGSTITMQVIRLSRRPVSRDLIEKCKEVFLATRLELSYSKEEILMLYASHAPFGGNVVGLDAACWRYFGRSPRYLSWSEAALLAVLPNAPSLIHPGKNSDILKKKRDGLLDKLYQSGKIDSLTCVLGKHEPIPEKPQPTPLFARHLLARAKKEGFAEQKLKSTINYDLQQRIEARLQDYHEKLKANQVYNGAVLVLDIATGNTLAYAGNVYGSDVHKGNEVDIIMSRRSTGSILKPFLYAACMDEGHILPATLLPDIPVMMNGFAPRNFSKQYDGAVPANNALIRSLNVPSVFLLKDYRYEKFYNLLANIGFTTLNRPADHYGLSLILGGAEGTLWDITGMYASMARTLKNYFHYPGARRYVRNDFHAPTFVERLEKEEPPEATSWLSASSIYVTLETLKELYRPAEETGWRHFNTSKKIAWKTGTSFGFRDGWAVGVTGDYAVGVWVGNADGEGRAGLTGTNAAAPLMFDIFSLLPEESWFEAPRSEMQRIATCRKSGQRASQYCGQTDTLWVTRSAVETQACMYHKTIHLSADEKYQVHTQCSDLADIKHRDWFVLPPVQEYYYKEKNISYKTLPPFKRGCEPSSSVVAMDLIYPKPNAKILLPRGFDGSVGSSVFELAHRDDNIAVFWHLDGVFVGMTKGDHRIELNPSEGEHVLTIVDKNGQSIRETFTIISVL